MPAKGHDRTKGAAGSARKPIKQRMHEGERKHDAKLARGPQILDVSPGRATPQERSGAEGTHKHHKG